MDITTEDPEIIQVRRTVVEMILSRHPNECLTCGRKPELRAADDRRRLRPPRDLPRQHRARPADRRVDACHHARPTQVHHLRPLHPGLPADTGRVGSDVPAAGIDTRIAAAGDISLADSPCVRCGQCSAHCPTGAIVEYDETQEVWDKLLDPDAFCVAQLAPAVRVAIGEAFGFPVGTNLTGKTYAALRRMGFDAVFDTNFGPTSRSWKKPTSSFSASAILTRYCR